MAKRAKRYKNTRGVEVSIAKKGAIVALYSLEDNKGKRKLLRDISNIVGVNKSICREVINRVYKCKAIEIK